MSSNSTVLPAIAPPISSVNASNPATNSTMSPLSYWGSFAPRDMFTMIPMICAISSILLTTVLICICKCKRKIVQQPVPTVTIKKVDTASSAVLSGVKAPSSSASSTDNSAASASSSALLSPLSTRMQAQEAVTPLNRTATPARVSDTTQAAPVSLRLAPIAESPAPSSSAASRSSSAAAATDYRTLLRTPQVVHTGHGLLGRTAERIGTGLRNAAAYITPRRKA